jgi:chromosome segregation ATPase
LEGQRETLIERQSILQVHINVLEYRQSQSADGDNNWGQVLQLLSDQRHGQQEELERSNIEIQHLQAVLEQAKAKVETQVNEYLAKSEEVQKLEQELQSRHHNVTEVRAKVALYEDMIQPLQSHINGLKDQLSSAPGGNAVTQLEIMLNELDYHSQN